MYAQPQSAALHLRALRALPFATVCTVVSAAGHELASGMQVPLRLVLLGWAAVWAAATLLAGRERGLVAITAALAAGEFGLHELFHLGGHAAMAASGHGSGSAAGDLLCGPLPHGTTAAQVLAAAGLDPHAYLAAAAAHGPGGLTPAMIAGHTLAALVGGWWLRRGERAVWRLLRARVLAPLRLLLAVLTGGAPEPAAPPRVFGGEPATPVAVLLRHAVVRRGPPAYALTA
jgi:hypothetical protein